MTKMTPEERRQMRDYEWELHRMAQAAKRKAEGKVRLRS